MTAAGTGTLLREEHMWRSAIWCLACCLALWACVWDEGFHHAVVKDTELPDLLLTVAEAFDEGFGPGDVEVIVDGVKGEWPDGGLRFRYSDVVLLGQACEGLEIRIGRWSPHELQVTFFFKGDLDVAQELTQKITDLIPEKYRGR